MRRSLDSIFNIDRRIVFIFVFLSILIPLLIPFPLPIRPTKHVVTTYDTVQASADRGGIVLLSFDFDPTGKAEQEPMARAVVRHIFARRGKVVVLGGTLTGQGLHEQILAECAQEFGAVKGENYVYFPWKAGAGGTLVINMAQNFASAYPEAKDYPLTRDIGSLRDFDYAIIFATGLGYVVNWINFAQGPCGLKLGAGVPGQMAPDLYNYVDSGQLTGLIGGLVGAAEYEQLVKKSGVMLVRRFSPADMPALTMRDLCAKLTATDRSALMEYIWSNLPDGPRAAVQKTLDAGYDRTTPIDKEAIAEAMNRLAGRPDLIRSADLKAMDVPESIAKTLDENPVVREREEEVRRRLFIERAFGGCLLPAQSAGQATQWMTPQSITHLALVVALLVGNACYLWGRRHARKKAKA